MKRKTKLLADIALFTAIGCVLNFLSMPVFGRFGRISLIYCYCYLCGMLLGPWAGFSTAFCADMIAAFIQIPVNGPWMPLISLSNGVMALIMGLIFRYWKKGGFAAKFSVSVLLDFVICTLILTPLGELPLFDIFPYAFPKSIGAAFGIDSPFLMMSVSKAIMQPVWICLNCFAAIFVYRRIAKLYFKQSSLFTKPKDAVVIPDSQEKPDAVLPLESDAFQR